MRCKGAAKSSPLSVLWVLLMASEVVSIPRHNGTEMLTKLRGLMQAVQLVEQPIQAYVVTNRDPHDNEYLSDHYKRLEFITGFSGSAGTAVITNEKALLWTDGRYYTQAASQMDENWTLMKGGLVSTPTEGQWLGQNLPPKSRIGVDPTVITNTIWQKLKQELTQNGHSLVPIKVNLIDQIWSDQPKPILNDIKPLAPKYTGKKVGDKVNQLRFNMTEKGVDVMLATSLDDIAWLLNLRGSDIEYNPVFFSYVIVTQKDVHFFINKERLTQEVAKHFANENVIVQVHLYEDVYKFLSNLLAQDLTIRKVFIPTVANYQFFSIIPEEKRLTDVSIITVTKAVKNNVEVEHMIQAHIKDGVSLARYFSWLEEEVPKGNVTEISGAAQLERFRQDTSNYIGPSFNTISSVGSNAAIIHYHPEPATNKLLTVKDIYLCDSGGQWLGGTTDVTRTMHFGVPSQMERECFTKVFKGQTALGTTVFPNKLKGSCLDSIARLALWKEGLDYGHGTGHGIGSYLNVHEGPVFIGNRPYPDDPGLEENMFISNEPGFYLEGKFGIRLENIVRIISTKTPYNFMDRGYLTMDTITLSPIQTKMLLISELTKSELEFLNSYHKKVFDIIGSILNDKGYDSAYQWLKRETQPV